MKLHQLPKTKQTRSAKRRGRGYSSGVGGHTARRGSKGQKSRNSVKAHFEGGQLPFVKRLPHLPGFKRFATKPAVLNVENLNVFSAGATVTPETLLEQNLLSDIPVAGVKLLGGGTLTVAVTVQGIACSARAREKVEAAGGTVA